ncbi:Bug family tripartite tricarboxylate transporter substrate binding protein [Diaphorobacter sp.]|uniref:Bug family tripartite tricarboxylate transporter substrate binding protein n=1 Tax=Diaphorobacter sp. TaxID=1934310 RepID=UPI0028AD8C76|nr:Bug family tripartite tricarboxylate transporter substrate binding protein [Diaphorobacter sp.]
MSHQNHSFNRRQMLALGAASLAAGQMPQAWASNAPLRFIVPFPAGGAADVMGRVIVDALKEDFTQPIIIENRAGASTRVAAEVLKNAPPDGNTVLMTLMDTMVIAPQVYNNLRYNPEKDFAPITTVADLTYGIAVNASSPYKTLDDYLKAAKKDPQVAALGVSGLGSLLHFVAFGLIRESKVDLSIIPFQGGALMVTNLMGNQIGSAVDGIGVFLEHHRNGKVRILAVSSKQRVGQLPDVPTFTELGYPSLVVDSGYSLYAPAGTPDASIKRWNTAMRKALSRPEVRQKIQTIGYQPTTGSTPEEVELLRKRLLERWTPIVKATGYKSD